MQSIKFNRNVLATAAQGIRVTRFYFDLDKKYWFSRIFRTIVELNARDKQRTLAFYDKFELTPKQFWRLLWVQNVASRDVEFNRWIEVIEEQIDVGTGFDKMRIKNMKIIFDPSHDSDIKAR